MTRNHDMRAQHAIMTRNHDMRARHATMTREHNTRAENEQAERIQGLNASMLLEFLETAAGCFYRRRDWHPLAPRTLTVDGWRALRARNLVDENAAVHVLAALLLNAEFAHNSALGDLLVAITEDFPAALVKVFAEISEAGLSQFFAPGYSVEITCARLLLDPRYVSGDQLTTLVVCCSTGPPARACFARSLLRELDRTVTGWQRPAHRLEPAGSGSSAKLTRVDRLRPMLEQMAAAAELQETSADPVGALAVLVSMQPAKAVAAELTQMLERSPDALRPAAAELTKWKRPWVYAAHRNIVGALYHLDSATRVRVLEAFGDAAALLTRRPAAVEWRRSQRQPKFASLVRRALFAPETIFSADFVAVASGASAETSAGAAGAARASAKMATLAAAVEAAACGAPSIRSRLRADILATCAAACGGSRAAFLQGLYWIAFCADSFCKPSPKAQSFNELSYSEKPVTSLVAWAAVHLQEASEVLRTTVPAGDSGSEDGQLLAHFLASTSACRALAAAAASTTVQERHVVACMTAGADTDTVGGLYKAALSSPAYRVRDAAIETAVRIGKYLELAVEAPARVEGLALALRRVYPNTSTLLTDSALVTAYTAGGPDAVACAAAEALADIA